MDTSSADPVCLPGPPFHSPQSPVPPLHLCSSLPKPLCHLAPLLKLGAQMQHQRDSTVLSTSAANSRVVAIMHYGMLAASAAAVMSAKDFSRIEL